MKAVTGMLGPTAGFCAEAAAMVKRAKLAGRDWLRDAEYDQLFATADRLGVGIINRRRRIILEARAAGLHDEDADATVMFAFDRERDDLRRLMEEDERHRIARARAAKKERRGKRAREWDDE